MASVIKGIPVVVYRKIQTGVDGFNRPVHEEVPETVQNVLVAPAGSDDVTDTTNLSETTVAYDLCIPKGDSREWRNVTVEFWGQKFQTVGDVREYIEALIPLDWNRKIRVEKYE